MFVGVTREILAEGIRLKAQIFQSKDKAVLRRYGVAKKLETPRGGDESAIY